MKASEETHERCAANSGVSPPVLALSIVLSFLQNRLLRLSFGTTLDDEASSSLYADSEAQVQAALTILMKGR